MKKTLSLNALAEIRKFFSYYPTISAGCRALGVSTSSGTYWLQGRHSPSKSIIQKMESLTGGAVHGINISYNSQQVCSVEGETFKDYILRNFISPKAQAAGFAANVFLRVVYNPSFVKAINDGPTIAHTLLYFAAFGGSAEYWTAVVHEFTSKKAAKKNNNKSC